MKEVLEAANNHVNKVEEDYFLALWISHEIACVGVAGCGCHQCVSAESRLRDEIVRETDRLEVPGEFLRRGVKVGRNLPWRKQA